MIHPHAPSVSALASSLNTWRRPGSSAGGKPAPALAAGRLCDWRFSRRETGGLATAIPVLCLSRSFAVIQPEFSALAIPGALGPGVALATGAILTALLIRLLARQSRRRADLEKLVQARTTALRESEESYRRQFSENSAVMLLSSFEDGRILDANAAAVRFYGYPRERLLSLHLTDINRLPAAALQDLIATITAAHGQRFEFQHRLADGSLRDVEECSSRIQLGDRPVLHSIITDITERNLAQQQLWESEARQKAILTQITDVVVILDQKGVVQYKSPKPESWFAWALDELVGFPFGATAHPEDRERIEHALSTLLLRAGSTITLAYRYRCNDGSYRPVEATAINLLHDREIQGVLVNYRDISERRRAEEALRESELRFRSLLQNIPSVAVQSYGPEGTTLYWNEASERLYGYTAAEAIGRNLVELIIPPAQRSAVQLAIQHMVATGQPLPPGELDLQRKDGSLVRIFSSHSLVRVPGRPVELFCMDMDLTERQRVEEALRESQANLKRAQAVSHTGSWQSDVRRNEIRWSDETYRIFELAPGTPVTHELFLARVHPDDLGLVDPVRHQAQPGESYEFRIVVGEGRIKWLRERVELAFDADGSLRGGFGIVQDITERKHAAQALRESEERLRTLIEAMPDFVCFKDSAGRWLEANEAGLRLFHLEAVPYRGKNDAELAEYQPFFREALLACADSDEATWRAGRVARGAEIVPQPAGEALVYDVIKVPLFTEEGGRKGLVVLGRDITERQRGEAALKESERSLRESQSIARLGSYALDIPAGRWSSSSILDDLFGIDASYDRSVAGWVALIHPAWQQPMADYFRDEVLGKRGRFDKKYKIIRRNDGAERWVHGMGELEFDARPQAVRMIGTILDITERQEAVERLQASEEQHRLLLQYLPAGVVVHAPDTSIILGNEAATRLLGLSLEQMQGKLARDPTWHFVREDGSPLPVAEYPVTRVVATGQPVQDLLLGIDRSPDHDRVWVLVNAFPQFDAHGQLRHVGATFIDLTARKQAEEEAGRLNQTLEQRVLERTTQLEASNRELEAFSYSVSHDLRTPLRAISGFSRLLRDGHAAQLDAEGLRMLGVVSSEAQRMGVLIDDLLAFSRLGRQPVRRVEVNLEALAQAVFADLAATVPERQLHLEVAPLPPAQADPALLRQVFVNLLGNAIKYTRHTPLARLAVGAHTANGETVYSVRDNGVGFDMKYVGRLFGVFQRLHSEADFEGTGVGLALTQRIVHRHGGRIWAEAKPGEGATFFFTLPPAPAGS